VNRSGLIAIQIVGALSILPYPFVLLANIMSMAAPGRTTATTLIWALLSLYPLVWIALYFFAWRAMGRGAVGLAIALSSVPAAATVLGIGVYLVSWIGFGLGTMGIGKGGLHSTTYPTNNPVLDAIILTGKDIEMGLDPAGSVQRTLRQVDSNRNLINVSVTSYGTPLALALRDLPIKLDGAITGRQDGITLVRGLVARGAHLSPEEAQDLHKSWLLRRALHDGPVRTAEENPLVWRIVTHDRGSEPKPFNPLTDQLPPRSDTPPPFILRSSDHALLNRATDLHGTPLYAALLDNAPDVCAVIVTAGGRLSATEERDPGAAAALRNLLDRDPDLKSAYDKAR
jgi:hypothetical protein